MIATISSNFSVIVIARPPSRGTISPETNAPGRKEGHEISPRTRIQENKPTEDGMNPNDIREECRPKGNEHSHRHEEHSRSAFDYEGTSSVRQI